MEHKKCSVETLPSLKLVMAGSVSIEKPLAPPTWKPKKSFHDVFLNRSPIYLRAPHANPDLHAVIDVVPNPQDDGKDLAQLPAGHGFCGGVLQVQTPLLQQLRGIRVRGCQLQKPQPSCGSRQETEGQDLLLDVAQHLRGIFVHFQLLSLLESGQNSGKQLHQIVGQRQSAEIQAFQRVAQIHGSDWQLAEDDSDVLCPGRIEHLRLRHWQSDYQPNNICLKMGCTPQMGSFLWFLFQTPKSGFVKGYIHKGIL